MAAKVGFLDTTVFLSYSQVDQIDWCVVLDAEEVVLVVAPVVIRQLNRHKDNPRTRKIRERAASALKKLERYSEQQPPLMVRDSVELRFRTTEPVIDFAFDRLSRDIDDDWLLATILEFRKESPASEIVLVTDDLGLKLKARAYQIQAQRLPEHLRLPEETDPEQARIRELEEEVRLLKLSVPELRLEFEDGKDYFRVELTRLTPSSPATKARLMEKVRVEHPRLDSAFLAVDLIAGAVSVPAEVTLYNHQLEQFFANYERHLEALDGFADSERRTVKLEIMVYNKGTCPAEDISVIIHFPETVQLLQEPPKPPDPPLPPAKPTKVPRIAPDTFRPSIPESAPASPSKTMWSNVSRPTFRSAAHQVDWHVKKINHGFSVSLDPLYIRFESWEAVKPFTVDYRVHAGNVPKMVTGQLHVIVEPKP